jgi:Zn-dependent peptidase ImmA (M78 family)
LRAWYHDYAQLNREDPVAFVGSLTTDTPVVEAAAVMTETLQFGLGQRGPTWADALRTLADVAEAAGVLVMINGVVGSNTHRKLDPHEFRGFALVDRLAPLIFVNGSDTKAAQIFTLVHELAHVWLGDSALSDADLAPTYDIAAERWCNLVAAEFLVALQLLADEYRPDEPLADELSRLARRFKVSTLVVLRRIHDVGQTSIRSASCTNVESFLKPSRRKASRCRV